jgi:hypothetical protein
MWQPLWVLHMNPVSRVQTKMMLQEKVDGV